MMNWGENVPSLGTSSVRYVYTITYILVFLSLKPFEFKVLNKQLMKDMGHRGCMIRHTL